MKYIILLNVLVWGGALAALPDAIDTNEAITSAVVDEHKIDYPTVSDAEYQESSEYRVVKDANESLRKIRGDL